MFGYLSLATCITMAQFQIRSGPHVRLIIENDTKPDFPPTKTVEVPGAG